MRKSFTSTNHKNALIRAAAVVIIAAFVIITQTGCGDKGSGGEPVTKSDFCLDTSCDISIYDITGGEGEEILDGAFKEIRQYEKILSRTVSGSDVDKINKASGKPVKVSEDTYDVLELGLEIGRLSGGRFDITVGRLTELWDFKSDDPKLPQQKEIDKALETVGYENVKLTEGDTVTLADPDAEIDLGGIAKGYIADRVTEYLEQQGVERAIINLGGNVCVIGSKADDTPWNIGIERPYSDRTELIGSVKVSDATVVTSGIYERMFKKNGRTYHHVLDPETGYPAETDLEAVTITAKKGYSAYCDGLSTTCLMLGRDKATALIEKLQKEKPEAGLEASFTDKDDKVTSTDGMKIEPVE